MGAFEDYVNANLGIRKPLITDAGPPSQSSKAAGIIGSQYVDSNTYFLYEKTGEDNALDWVKIADLGQSRGGEPGGENGSVQFNSGDSFGGSIGLMYDYESGLLSGESGRFDYIHSDFITGQTGNFEEELIVGNPNLPTSEDVFVVDDGNITAAGSAEFTGPLKAPTGYFNEIIVSGDAYISGDFYVSGTTYVNEVVDTTISGTVSGHTGIFNMTSGENASFTNSLTISGVPVSTGGNSSRDYPVLTGVEFNTSSNILSFFRDLGASNIDIDLSSLAGGAGGSFYQSNLWWEESNGDLILLNEEATTSHPATQLFEESQSNSYSPRESLFSSSTEAAQFFEEINGNVTLKESSSLSPINNSSAVSTQWFEDIGSDQLAMRESSIDTSNPAVQLWESAGSDKYTPRSEPYSSNSESAQYFEELGSHITTIDSAQSLDTDGDGTGNNTDTDDDGDGTPDVDDDFPLDSTEDTDTDGDGTGNNTDTDDDGDGTPDVDDDFPLDSTEDTDTDGDGTGNNADTDDDGDGTPDVDDDFPLDSTEDTDTDGDGTGNNADTDDDGDGTPDVDDDCFSVRLHRRY